MMRFFFTLILCSIASLGFAEPGALNFTPPPGDFSVVFLNNLFGVVDGVLHGTGSQMLGNLFAVFNSAVIALGGIIIMYTLIVSTMNTAHEGQFLGQKWSSIWVPVRAVTGIALLMPKASGYCMVQIFVMWVCVQGVGAADKIWEAALSYLNRGGVIIHQQMSPSQLLGSSQTSATGSDTDAVIKAASVILKGQVCMLGIQKALEQVKNTTNNTGENKTGPCVDPKGAFVQFCNSTVPDFLSTVNAVSVQQSVGEFTVAAPPPCTPITKQVEVGRRKGIGEPIYQTQTVYDPPGCNTAPPPTPPLYAVPMPNFSEAPYSRLNGICGTIKWRPVQATKGLLEGLDLNANETQTVQSSRAIAIQQMYVDLATVAQTLVNNSPILTPKPQSEAKPAIPGLAWVSLGAPLDYAGIPCSVDAKANCTQWGTGSGTANANALFNGAEFYGALADYRAVMTPTQRLLAQGQNLEEAQSSRAFIQQANSEGWIMAGSYFFRLARLNQTAINAGMAADRDTGLDSSVSIMPELAELIPSSKESCSPVDYACVCADSSIPEVCQWLQGKRSYASAVQALITGEGVAGITKPVSAPNFIGSAEGLVPQYGPAASTVEGYITNAQIFANKMAAQPGQEQIPFAMQIKLDMHPSWLSIHINTDWNCGSLLSDFGCNIKAAFKWLFNELILNIILSFFMDMIANIVSQLFMLALSVPLQVLAQEFVRVSAILQLPNVNPVIALANMGVEYINSGMQHWIKVTTIALVAGAVPLIAPAIVFLLMMIGPIIGTWIGVMVTIGFLTAFYVPLIPYMVFTFGSIAWLMAVIEAMVAAPIVALGVSSPEGDQAFGKGEQAIMLLMNVFLRPSMMVIGYIAGIMLSYVGVWILISGFSNALAFIQGGTHGVGYDRTWGAGDIDKRTLPNDEFIVDTLAKSGGPTGLGGYFGINASDLQTALGGDAAIRNLCDIKVNNIWNSYSEWQMITKRSFTNDSIADQKNGDRVNCVNELKAAATKYQRIGQAAYDLDYKSRRVIPNTLEFCAGADVMYGKARFDACMKETHLEGQGKGEPGQTPFKEGECNQIRKMTDNPDAEAAYQRCMAKTRFTPIGGGESVSGGYTGWAGAFSVFFMVLIFTTMYITIVQEAFNLISTLPDKILRWIGGQQESFGQESQKWTQQTQQKVEGAGQDTGAAGAKMGGDAQEQLAKKVGDDKKGGHKVET